MSGFDMKGAGSGFTGTTAGNIVGEFTGVEKPILKGQVIQVLNKELTPMEPSANMGNLDRSWTVPAMKFKAFSAQPKLQKFGEYSDGSSLLSTCSSSDGPGHIYSNQNVFTRVHKGEVLWTMNPYNDNGSPLSANIPSGYAKAALEPLSGDMYVVCVQNDPATYRAIMIFKFDEDGQFVETVGAFDMNIEYCLGSGGMGGQFKVEVTGDKKMIFLASTGGSNNTLKCMVIDLVAGTVIRDGLEATLPVSYSTGMNTTQTHNKTIWLNKERTRFVLPYRTYNSNYYVAYFLFDTASGTDKAKYPLAYKDMNHGSAFTTTDLILTADQEKYHRDGMATKGFANAEGNRIFIPRVTVSQLYWDCFYMDDDTFQANPDQASTYNTANNTLFIASWRINGYFCYVNYYNSTLNGTVVKESDGTTVFTNQEIGTNYSYSSVNCMCADEAENMAWLVLASGTIDNATGYQPLILGFELEDGKLSEKVNVQISFPYTPKGRHKNCFSIGDHVIVLQGHYAAASTFASLRYHLFNKITGLWEEEGGIETTKITNLTANQNWWQSSITSDHFRVELIGSTIYLYGHGLKHIGTGTEDLKKWQTQTLNLITGMLLGVAESDQVNGKVQVLLSGTAKLHADYAKTFKSLDHTSIGGNKATLLGSVAMLPGIGA